MLQTARQASVTLADALTTIYHVLADGEPNGEDVALCLSILDRDVFDGLETLLTDLARTSVPRTCPVGFCGECATCTRNTRSAL